MRDTAAIGLGLILLACFTFGAFILMKPDISNWWTLWPLCLSCACLRGIA